MSSLRELIELSMKEIDEKMDKIRKELSKNQENYQLKFNLSELIVSKIRLENMLDDLELDENEEN